MNRLLKNMSRLGGHGVLPILAFTSLGTVACTGETAEQGAPLAATTQSPAELLAGEGGTKTAPISGYATGQTITSGKATLVVDGVSYDLLSYSFGISNPNDGLPGRAGTSDLATGKATLADLSIVVRPSATEAVLRKAVLAGTHFDTARILLFPTVEAGMKAPKPIELAVFEKPYVNTVATSAGGGAVEAYNLQALKLTVSYAGAKVMFDATTNTMQSDTCSPEGVLPAYTQANAGELSRYPLLPGAVRIDSVAVGISNAAPTPGGTSDIATGKAQLEGITLAGSLEKGGVCGFYYAALGRVMAAAKFGIAGEVSSIKGTKPYESTSWTACAAGVSAVQIASGGDAAPFQVLQLQAGGLLRTDRTIDPKSGKTNESSIGWSFLDNKPAASCSDVSL